MLLTRAITRYERRAACTAIAATRRQHSRHGHVSPGSHNHRYFISHYKQFTTRDFWPAETPVLRIAMLKYPQSRPISGISACQTAERVFGHAKAALSRHRQHRLRRHRPITRHDMPKECDAANKNKVSPMPIAQRRVALSVPEPASLPQYGGTKEGDIMERTSCSIVGCTHEAVDFGMCTEHFTSSLVHGSFQYSPHSARPSAN